MPFSSDKAGQIAAVFAAEAGGRINVLKLVKLIYLADRHSMELYSHPITYDNWVSMDHGPVPSTTLNLINGHVQDVGDTWGRWIADRENHTASLAPDALTNNGELNRDSLDQLSDADIAVIRQVWADLGHMDQWALVKFTHEHCPEWQDPQGSSSPISEWRLLRELGRTEEEAIEEAQNIIEQRQLDSFFASL